MPVISYTVDALPSGLDCFLCFTQHKDNYLIQIVIRNRSVVIPDESKGGRNIDYPPFRICLNLEKC